MKHVLMVVFFGILGLPLFAQNSMSVQRSELASGIAIDITVGDLDNSQQLLSIADKTGQAVALQELWLDDRQIWLKRSSDDVTVAGSAHWMDDEASLIIDLDGLKDLLAQAQTLRCVVVLLDSKEDTYSLEIGQTDSRADAPAQLIRSIEIDLK
ncbi:MAG: hypothetical protein ACRBF0_02160 [Calditrichia bacterium]